MNEQHLKLTRFDTPRNGPCRYDFGVGALIVGDRGDSCGGEFANACCRADVRSELSEENMTSVFSIPKPRELYRFTAGRFSSSTYSTIFSNPDPARWFKIGRAHV